MQPPLLVYLSSADDVQRFAVGPALAAAAERAGFGFECYYDALRRGRHFGGGDPNAAPPGWASGSLVAGGRHADQVLWLASRYELVALGDPGSVLWPALEAAGAESLTRSVEPAELYRTALERLAQPVPETVLVLDGAPQGRAGLVAAPYLYPAILDGGPVLALDASAGEDACAALEALGARVFRALYVEAGRAAAFPRSFESVEGELDDETYATFTAALADRHSTWGRGVLLGDPELVAAQLPKARRLRLLPLYGRPQTAVIERAAPLLRGASEPVFGRQYDDRDFFELARLGRSLQLVDPGPPFDAAGPAAVPEPLAGAPEPDDAQLRAWAEEHRVLVTVLFWAGMVRELDCVPRILDLVAATGVAGGLVLTTEAIEQAGGVPLALLAAPPGRGGVLGLLEPLLASAGRGVAAETLLPPGSLAPALAEARSSTAKLLPPSMVPRGWWPLLDAPLVRARERPVGWRSGRPVLRFTPRAAEEGHGAGDRGRDLRGVVGDAARRLGLRHFLETRRPFGGHRPGELDTRIAEAVRDAGFSYMWTKARFGRPEVAWRDGDFVALPLTAGSWDGWSPFYTVTDERGLRSAERRLLRSRRAGWLTATVDSTLWAMSGEILEHGPRLYRIAELAAAGGSSGRLVNVTPNVVARYARLLDGLR